LTEPIGKRQLDGAAIGTATGAAQAFGQNIRRICQ
jgi:hypothetical protein